ncbi:hypothetical protein ACWGKX_29680, partial [Streptomyces tricolor]
GGRRGAGRGGPPPPPPPAGARFENIARFLDFVSESTARAAEQARAILHTKPGQTPSGAAPGGAAEPGSER